MNEKFVIVGLYLVIGLGNSAPKRPGKSCGIIKLRADRVTRDFTSPGYPSHFSAQTQCTWLIEAPKSERVKLTIKDFFLTIDERCEGQYVSFSDDATNTIYGPICGKRKRGEIISTGNKLRVKLESDSISKTKSYKGFKFLYSTTKEQPTFPLRNRLRNRNTPTHRGDVIVDDNNNDVINERNRQENQRHEGDSHRMNGDNSRNFENVSPPPPKSGKTSQGIIRATVPPRRRLSDRKINHIITKKQGPSSKLEAGDSGKSKDDSTKKYLAITLPVFIIMIVFAFIIVKLRRNRKKIPATTHPEGTQQYSMKSPSNGAMDLSDTHTYPQTETEESCIKSEYSKCHNLPSPTTTGTGIAVTRLQTNSFHKDRRSVHENNSRPNQKPKSKNRIKSKIRGHKPKNSQDNEVRPRNLSRGKRTPTSKTMKRDRNISTQTQAGDEKRNDDMKQARKRRRRHAGVINTVKVETDNKDKDRPTNNSKASCHRSRSKSRRAKGTYKGSKRPMG